MVPVKPYPGFLIRILDDPNFQTLCAHLEHFLHLEGTEQTPHTLKNSYPWFSFLYFFLFLRVCVVVVDV